MKCTGELLSIKKVSSECECTIVSGPAITKVIYHFIGKIPQINSLGITGE